MNRVVKAILVCGVYAAVEKTALYAIDKLDEKINSKRNKNLNKENVIDVDFKKKKRA